MPTSTTSSTPAASRSKLEVFIIAHEGSIWLAKKLVASAKACGIDTSSFNFVMTDGSVMPGFKNISCDFPQGAPVAANRAFMHVAELCYNARKNFLLLDADCTFTRPGAMKILEKEFEAKMVPVVASVSKLPRDPWSFNGNAAYRWDTWEIFELDENPVPDDFSYDLFLSRTAFPHYVAPATFIFQDGPQTRNVSDLDWLPDHIAIHHPCVDGSVADRVIEKFSTVHA